jgi:hypothetical protein
MIIKKELVLDAITSYITSNKEEIDLFLMYGSYVTIDEKVHSNINFYYVPTKNSKKDLSLSFILINVGYYLERITFEKLIDISNYENNEQYKLINSEILFYKDETIKNEFLKLKLNVYEFKDFKLKTKQEIELAKLSFFKKTHQSYHLFTHLLNALVYSKKSFLKKGLFDFENELLSLDIDSKYINYLKDIYLKANDKELKSIILKIEDYVLKNNQDIDHHIVYDSFYEQLNNLYTKLLLTEDLIYKFLYIDHIQNLLDHNFIDEDIVSRIHQTSDEEEIINQQAELYHYLMESSYKINRFNTIKELEEFLKDQSKKVLS